MAPNKTLTGLLALSALSSAAVPNQRRAQTTQALLLPIEAPEDQALWASVITADASSTEYLVACQTASAHPDACDGPYTGVTLTQGPQTMGLSMGGRTYACDIREQDAFCEISQQDDEDSVETKTIARDQWAHVAIAVAEPTEIPYLEMRAPKGGGGRGGSSGGGKSSGSSGKSSSSSKKGSSSTGKKGGSGGDDEDCNSGDSDYEECKKKKDKDNAGAKVNTMMKHVS
ncbi:uncharacterized protein F5Z01DRAFT_106490 [Emericellopsis atlantica]|uniref:Uncharacterized protein n=1 Tax=Emericellopsis atlantica TaxID=2614577 RepID=A0A9P8CPT6_9HYPO|nr:uncharacterized protein F5Z01DRAFT_106490 [Emericellopsis atlantica]KAG9254460.1 hypothetical protein F5Z01DRAFT_106490 [Emericellopsis atlantica]